MAHNPFVGAWRLLSWENRSADGRVSHPLGREISGYILYSADGYMNVAIMAAGRPRYGGDDALGGTVDERARAAKTYLSYAGTYELGDGEIIHHVQVSLFPNWVGGEQRRFYELDGDRLTLSTAPMLLAGIERRAFLVWERAALVR
jgi:hypothetical protein